MPNPPIDLTGQTFGRLTVLGHAGKNRFHNSLWTVECSCGAVKDAVLYQSLKSGRTTSCGECGRLPPQEEPEDWC